jgi:signal peptidase
MTGDAMGGGLGKGSVAFERVVPVSDVRPGDVITYRRPAETGEGGVMVTHRVVAVRADGLVTRSDASPRPDPWVVPTDGPTLSRVELSVPYVGWVYLFFSLPVGWVATLVAAVALVALTWSRRGSRKPVLRQPDPDSRPSEVAMASAMLSDTRGTGGSEVKGE